MSLLGTQVFANPATPMWASTNGGVIKGDLVVEGTLDVTQTLNAQLDIAISASDNPEVFNGRIVGDTTASGRLLIEAVDEVAFAKIGSGVTNTFLTFGASDTLNVNGVVAATTLNATTVAATTLNATTVNATTVNATTVNATSFSPIRGDITIAGIGAGQQAMTFVGGLAGNIIQENALYLMSFDIFILSGGAAVPSGLHSLLVQTSPATSAVGWASTITIPAAPEYRVFSVTGLLQGFGAGPQPLNGTFFLPNALPAGSTIETSNAILLRIA